ncbi:uncharacterized protein LOC103795876 [Callithrix jacchus]
MALTFSAARRGGPRRPGQLALKSAERGGCLGAGSKRENDILITGSKLLSGCVFRAGDEERLHKGAGLLLARAGSPSAAVEKCTLLEHFANDDGMWTVSIPSLLLPTPWF